MSPAVACARPRGAIFYILGALLGSILATSCLAASPAHPVSSQPAQGLIVVPLGRGHSNRLRVAATIEGVKGLMILDTGASATLLNDQKFSAVRPDASRKLPPGVPTSTSMNGVRIPITLVRDLRVGGVDLGPSVVAMAAPRFLYDQYFASDQQFDGLLGETFLRHFRAVVDCGRLVMYLNTNPHHPLNLGPALTQAGWTRVPMTDYHNNFLVPCEINGHRFRLLVDTGSPFVAMDRGLLAGAQVAIREIPMQGGVIGARAERAGFANLPSMMIGQYAATGVQVVADRNSMRYFQDSNIGNAGGKVLGLLGGSFLAAHNAIIDVGGNALYLRRDKATH